MIDGAPAARVSRPAWELLRAAAGSPRAFGGKVRAVGRTLRAWLDGRALAERLETLQVRGLIDAAPGRVQLVVGSIDMLRFWISPAAADYYAERGISFTFHQVLRVLDDPAAMIDPVGFFVERDAIIGHLLQVVHANPIYDVQLLSAHRGGLEALETQTRSMLDGTHPRWRSISAIVEEPHYHARLLAFVEAFRADPRSPPPLRSNIAGRFDALERTFGTLPAAMRYFCRLPDDVPGAVRHLVSVRTFPTALAEPSPGVAA